MSAASESANESTLRSKGDAMAAPAIPRVSSDAEAASASQAESIDWGKRARLSALRRFAAAITLLAGLVWSAAFAGATVVDLNPVFPKPLIHDFVILQLLRDLLEPRRPQLIHGPKDQIRNVDIS